MFFRAIKVHQTVNKALHKGSFNTDGASEEVRNLRFIQLLIIDWLQQNFFLSLSKYAINPELLMHLIRAILAMSTECGNCGEHAQVAFYQFLKVGIDKSVELMRIEESKSENHGYVVLDRDQKADIQNPQEWKDVIIYNSWNGSTWKSYTAESKPSLADLTLNSNYKNPTNRVILRLDENLSKEQWRIVTECFKNLREHLKTYAGELHSEVYYTCNSWQKMTSCTLPIAKTLIENFNKTLDAEITACEQLSLLPAIKPLQNGMPLFTWMMKDTVKLFEIKDTSHPPVSSVSHQGRRD